MLSLRQTLKNFSSFSEGFPQGHLPAGFDASKGIRSLFPASVVPVSLSLLSSWVTSSSGTTATSIITGNFTIEADGTGNWFFSVTLKVVGGDSFLEAAAGFVFGFSDDKLGRGFVGQPSHIGSTLDTGAAQPQPLEVTGSDPWIRNHWSQIISNNPEAFFWVGDSTGFASLPNFADAATDNGFAGFSMLQGATVILDSGLT